MKQLKASLFSSTLVALALGIALVPFSTAHAVTPADWRAGNIIDDGIFTDKNDMSAAQVQAFLEAKVPVCDVNGTNGYYKGMLRRDYGASVGSPAPYTCLRDFWEVPKTQPGNYMPANNYGGAPVPAGAKRASEIIWQAAQDFNISPRVLLVTLQKESGMVTDVWPFRHQLVYAMGSHCPDSGPGGSSNCDPNYSGFSMQIRESASMFRSYLNNMQQPWWTNKRPYQNNTIRYDVEVSCGGSPIFMDNKATTALYIYTPYQPNQAALNAGYGSAEPCGAYGNRNFWLYFNDWFGAPTGPSLYTYGVTNQDVYSDSTYQAKVNNNPLSLRPGASAYVTLTVRNTGNQVWSKSSVRLGTLNTQDRASAFKDGSWLSESRPAQPLENTIPPGSDANFRFKINAPYKLGTFNETFGILIEGRQWLGGSIVYPIKVETPDPFYDVDVLGFTAYPDEARTKAYPTASIPTYPGAKTYMTVTVKNAGNRSLPTDTTRVGTAGPLDRHSSFTDASWLTVNRPAKPTESTLDIGATGTFKFSLTAPQQTGTYNESFGMLVEGQRWMNMSMGTLSLAVQPRPPVDLTDGQKLNHGQELVSSDGRYKLVFQPDGNLVLYSPFKALWSTRTTSLGGQYVILQGDGNMVMYGPADKPLWHTLTYGKGASHLTVQDDGNMVLYNNTGYTWHTNTYGQQ